MATKGTRKVNNIQRLPGPPPGLLSFVSPKDQRDFNNYLEAQYKVWKKVRDRLGYNIRRSYTFKNKRNTLRKELTEVVKPPNSDSLVITNVSDSYIPIINPSFSTDLPRSSSQNLSNSNHSNVSPIFQVVSTRYSPPAIINESLPPTPDPYLFMTPSRQSIPKSVQLVFNEPQGQADSEDIFVGVTPEKHSFSKPKKLKNDRIIVGVTPERIKFEKPKYKVVRGHEILKELAKDMKAEEVKMAPEGVGKKKGGKESLEEEINGRKMREKWSFEKLPEDSFEWD